VDFTNKSNNEGIDAAKQLLRKLLDEPTGPAPIPIASEIQSSQQNIDPSAELKADAQHLARQRAEAIRKAREKKQQEHTSQVIPSAPTFEKKVPQQKTQSQSSKLFPIIAGMIVIGLLCMGGGWAIWDCCLAPTSTTHITITLTPSIPPIVEATTETPPEVIPTTPAPPEKQELAFVSDRGQAVGDFQAFVIDPDNPNPTSYQPFSENPTGYERVYWPSFCGDQLAVESQSKNGNSQWIYFLDRISPPSQWKSGGGTQLGQPHCSPDGRYISYSALNQGKWYTLVVADVADGSIILSSLQNNIVGRASWPRSTESMLFPIYIDSDNWSFYFMKSFGVASYDPQILNLNGVSPSISPDGQQIAYYCPDNRDDQYGPLCVADISGGSPRVLVTTDISHNGDFHRDTGVWVSSVTPVWSSDGQWIYYIDYEGGDYDIFRIPSNGGSRENITRDWSSNEFMPATR